MIEKRGGYWYVLHGHAKKKGSKTDKPKGSVIGKHKTKKEALDQHKAIIMSQKRRGK